MKIPCEIVVLKVLPMIRRELAIELVKNHGMSQAEVARKFDVTDAAISQYLKKKRGDESHIEQSNLYGRFMQEIKDSASRIVKENSDSSVELCRICWFVKEIGLLSEIYMHYSGTELPSCALQWGNRDA